MHCSESGWFNVITCAGQWTLIGYILHHLANEKDSKLPFKFVRRY